MGVSLLGSIWRRILPSRGLMTTRRTRARNYTSMNRQLILTIVIGVLAVPLIWLMADNQKKLQQQAYEHWKDARAKRYEWIATHPDRIKDYPDIIKQISQPGVQG